MVKLLNVLLIIFWDDLEQHITNFFDSVNLSDLIKNKNGNLK